MNEGSNCIEYEKDGTAENQRTKEDIEGRKDGRSLRELRKDERSWKQIEEGTKERWNEGKDGKGGGIGEG